MDFWLNFEPKMIFLDENSDFLILIFLLFINDLKMLKMRIKLNH